MIQNGTKVTGKVTVKPTTAYQGDSTDGKLTLYVPYYGVTGIGQITLSASASGNVQIKNMQILPKKANDTSATVTFQLDEGASAPFSDGEEKECEPLPVLVYDNYTIKGRDNGFETAANFQGTPVSNSWLGKGTCKYDPTTKTYTQTIDIAINTDTKSSRAGAVVVFSPSGRELTRFIVEQAACEATNPDKPVINDITINKLVPSGANSANCYIITAPGRYELPAYMGAYSNSELADNLLCKGTPDIVWNDNESNNKIEFYQGHLSQDRIIIDVNPTKEKGVVTGHGSSISPGNAVISINDANGIKWSWHLWFCTDDPRTSSKLQNYEVTTSNDQTVTYSVMNRNLGASSFDGIDLSAYISGASYAFVWHSGLYYQWGRKDPLRDQSLVIDDVTSLEYSTSTKNPSIFYSAWEADGAGWAETKTKDDPCPPGYKVPPTNIWAKGDNDINRTINMQEGFFIYDLVTQKLYPYSGYIDSSGNYHDGTEGESVNRNYPVLTKISPAYFPASTETFSTKPSYTPMQYCNFYFDAIDMTETGGLWGCDDQMFEYGYDTNGARITGYEYRSGSWKQGGLFTKYYYASYPLNTKDYIQVNEYPHSSLSEENANTILQTLIIPYVDFLNIGSVFIDNKIYSKGPMDHAAGLQVRCAVDR